MTTALEKFQESIDELNEAGSPLKDAEKKFKAATRKMRLALNDFIEVMDQSTGRDIGGRQTTMLDLFDDFSKNVLNFAASIEKEG